MYQHAFTGELIIMRLRILRLQVLSEMQKQVRSSLVPSPTFLSRHATLGTECCVTRQTRLRVRLGWALVVHLSEVPPCWESKKMTEEWQGQTLGVHFIEVSALKTVKENDWITVGINSGVPLKDVSVSKGVNKNTKGCQGSTLGVHFRGVSAL